MEPKPHHWLALCLCTETDRPEEWPYIAQVIFSRVGSPRFPDTLAGVILQPSQFSAFNAALAAYDKKTDDGLAWAMYRHIKVFQLVFKAHVGHFGSVLYAHALDFTHDAGEDEQSQAQEHITPDTLHYYSPRSMVPAGSVPKWATSRGATTYTVPGIDPDRFTFVRGVR